MKLFSRTVRQVHREACWGCRSCWLMPTWRCDPQRPRKAGRRSVRERCCGRSGRSWPIAATSRLPSYATRATDAGGQVRSELAAEFPLHVVCEWIGNSKTDRPRTLPAGHRRRFRQGAAKCAAVTGGTGLSGEDRRDPGNEETPGERGFGRCRSTVVKRQQNGRMDDTGLEKVSPTRGKSSVSGRSGAESDVSQDSDLKRLNLKWKTLSPEAKLRIIAVLDR
jgi:hypothetical protein